eukprot:CAMPEP_0194444530 /NCGR_PEP_ID=MMETSP0176-20130528/127325_1 /TAXON_ID=216777 /ORGANISM="Proboscia alata, Strain PI-D3" /LENGTH=899 /DNA_ID=CAMNT_0039270925 /DNA_START=360 /DNA_END=3060 /DNA_ORIENTATION=-
MTTTKTANKNSFTSTTQDENIDSYNKTTTTQANNTEKYHKTNASFQSTNRAHIHSKQGNNKEDSNTMPPKNMDLTNKLQKTMNMMNIQNDRRSSSRRGNMRKVAADTDGEDDRLPLMMNTDGSTSGTAHQSTSYNRKNGGASAVAMNMNEMVKVARNSNNLANYNSIENQQSRNTRESSRSSRSRTGRSVSRDPTNHASSNPNNSGSSGYIRDPPPRTTSNSSVSGQSTAASPYSQRRQQGSQQQPEIVLPPPPENAIKTRCYRLDLDSEWYVQLNNPKLAAITGATSPINASQSFGPMEYIPPPIEDGTRSRSLGDRPGIRDYYQPSMSDDEDEDSDVENEHAGGMASENQKSRKGKKKNSMADTTAQIFRGLVINRDGTVMSTAVGSSISRRNYESSQADGSSKNNSKADEKSKQADKAGSSKSRRNAENSQAGGSSKNNAKADEKSRQAAKIDKMKNAVEAAMKNGNKKKSSDDSDDTGKMLSLYIMGDYDDMKHLVRDGSKRLKEATSLPDEYLLSSSRSRNPKIKKEATNIRASLSLSSQSRTKRTSSIGGGQPPSQLSPSTNSVTRKRSPSVTSSGNKGSRQHKMPNSTPPKLSRHPRDKGGSRRTLGGDAGGRSPNSNNNSSHTTHGVSSIFVTGGCAGDSRSPSVTSSGNKGSRQHKMPNSTPPKLSRHPRDKGGSRRTLGGDAGGRSPNSNNNSSHTTHGVSSIFVTGGCAGDSTSTTNTGSSPRRRFLPKGLSHPDQACSDMPIFGGGDSDWSDALNFSRGFHSIWNCGATGAEKSATKSPTREKGGSPHHDDRSTMATGNEKKITTSNFGGVGVGMGGALHGNVVKYAEFGSNNGYQHGGNYNNPASSTPIILNEGREPGNSINSQFGTKMSRNNTAIINGVREGAVI